MFGKIGKFGVKVANTVVNGLKIGQKLTGNVEKIGNKVVDRATQVLNTVDKIPFVGEAALPATAMARGAVGIVSNVASMAGGANKMMKGAEKGVRGVQSALHAGNTQQALGIMRDTAKDEYAAGKDLKSQARSTLERARK